MVVSPQYIYIHVWKLYNLIVIIDHLFLLSCQQTLDSGTLQRQIALYQQLELF